MSETYEDILSGSWDEVPEVKVLPVGNYRLRGLGATFKPPKDAESNPRVLFVYKPIEPQDDVDQDLLAELGEGYDIEGNRVVANFFVETGADWDAVRNHLAKHGVDPASYESVKKSLEAVKGRDIMAYLDERTYTNAAGEQVTTNDPKSFAPVED